MLFVWSGCDLLAVKGGGTETESNVQVVGKPVNQDGSPAVGARVVVRSTQYLADPKAITPFVDTNLETVVDAQGWFRLKNIPTGSFRIEISGRDSTGAISDFELTKKNSGLELTQLKLTALGKVTGVFAQDTSVELVRYVQVYGLERWVKTDNTGKFSLPNLPAGKYALRCSSPQAFRSDTVINNVEVISKQQTVLPQITLGQKVKLAFSIDATGLKLEGVSSTNPVILDNELWEIGIEGQYIWAKASLGLLNFRGNIVTNDMGGQQKTTMQIQMHLCERQIVQARTAGMVNLIKPVYGAAVPLSLPVSGRISDLIAVPSVGSDLIVAEARKASPSNPLFILVGGPLTTVAQAYLTDPSIAPNMVVAGIYSHGINSYDRLATSIVIKNCRFIEWGRNYEWQGPLDLSSSALPPATAMWKLRYSQLFSSRDTVDLSDVAPAVYLFNRSVWTAAEKLVTSNSGEVRMSTESSYDFLAIPLLGNNFSVYQNEIFSTLSDSNLYQPQILPGILAAEGFVNNAGVSLFDLDSAAGTMGVNYASGSSSLHTVKVIATKIFSAKVYYRSPKGGVLGLNILGQSPLINLNLPPSATWSTVQIDSLTLPAGISKLNVSISGGSADLDRIEFQ